MLNKNHENKQSINLWESKHRKYAVRQWCVKRIKEKLEFFNDLAGILCFIGGAFLAAFGLWAITILIFSL